jgi:hypothetical protein
MRLVWQLIGTLLLVGLMLHYWWLIVLVVAAVIVYKRAPVWWARYQAARVVERERVAGIAARADRQHAWVLAGDPRGLYGAGWTTVREFEALTRKTAAGQA